MKKMHRIRILSFLFVFVLVSFTVWAASESEIAEKIESAYSDNKPLPIVSQMIKGLNIDQAYQIQNEYVKLKKMQGEVVIGYKAGLTAAPAQIKFGVNEAVRGVLLQSMLRWPGTMYQKSFTSMFIETEIGYRFEKEITETVSDIETLKKSVAIVFPAIELPDVAYTDMKQIKGTDLIATNVAARKVLVGKAVSVRAMDLNEVKVNLFHNGEEVGSGIGKNALGDQWEALKWTVNNVLANGDSIKSGDVVITGSLTKLMPTKPGQYVADFGDFGSIEFECK